MSSHGRLAPQARPHALAELEATIAKAETLRDRQQRDAMSLGDEEARRAKAYLRFAEERLAQLQRSREVLIGGEDQTPAEEDSEVPT